MLQKRVTRALETELLAFHQADKDAPAGVGEATTLDLKTMQGKWLCEASEESGKVSTRKWSRARTSGSASEAAIS